MKVVYKANPDVVLSEKHDDWAVLTNTKNGEACGVSRVGVFIWKKIDGVRSRQNILTELGKALVGGLPPEAGDDFDQFVAPLVSKGWLTK